MATAQQARTQIDVNDALSSIVLAETSITASDSERTAVETRGDWSDYISVQYFRLPDLHSGEQAPTVRVSEMPLGASNPEALRDHRRPISHAISLGRPLCSTKETLFPPSDFYFPTDDSSSSILPPDDNHCSNSNSSNVHPDNDDHDSSSCRSSIVSQESAEEEEAAAAESDGRKLKFEKNNLWRWQRTNIEVNILKDEGFWSRWTDWPWGSDTPRSNAFDPETTSLNKAIGPVRRDYSLRSIYVCSLDPSHCHFLRHVEDDRLIKSHYVLRNYMRCLQGWEIGVPRWATIFYTYYKKDTDMLPQFNLSFPWPYLLQSPAMHLVRFGMVVNKMEGRDVFSLAAFPP